MAVGILLALAGLWLILRTVVRDSSGRTLVDRILGAGAAQGGAGAR
jgi:hypothetical protein